MIRSLPTSPEKSDLLTGRFLLDRETFRNGSRLEAFYAPFHGINKDAKIVIVGVTPGPTQMHGAFREAWALLKEGMRAPIIYNEIRRRTSFGGRMRPNLTKMLNKIGVAEYLGLDTAEALFGEAFDLVHTTSAYRYPILKTTKTKIRNDFKGDTPRVIHSGLLTRMAEANLVRELKQVPQDALIIPLGKNKEKKVPKILSDLGIDQSPRILWGVPHPSTSNQGHINLFLKSGYRSVRKRLLKL